MNITKTIDYLNNGRVIYFRWLKELSLIKKIWLSLLFALITGIFAQIRIPLGFTPVPLTGQVFVVLLSGVLLGGFCAGMSMIFYITLGALGIPWFAGFRAGINPGPTLGYLLGFIPAAIFVGLFAHRHKRLFYQIMIMLIGLLLIYLFGALNFAFLLKTDFLTTIKLAVLPFIPFDIIKAILAGFLSRAIIPDD
jgi:biotin transport system substrate-specific component|uniref:Biotin transporter n=1 Tax=candidate division WOR-3 bacterium TaxID=2052148 RepID=A0A7V1EIV6_UNCW3